MAGKAQLILVMGLALILGLVSLNMTRWSKSAGHNSAYYYEALTSHNIALAGAQVAIAKSVSDSAFFGSYQYYEYTSGGSYTIERDTAEPLVIRSISNYQGYNEMFHDTVEVYLAPVEFTSFTLFSWMTNDEGGFQWISGDSVMGELFTNGEIAVNGSPVFMDKVSAVGGFNPKPGKGTNQAKYNKGYESGVDSIYFPTDLSLIFDVADDSAGRYYDVPDIWVTLDPGNPAVAGDGKAYISTSKGGPIYDTVSLNSGFNGVLMGDSSVHVQGTLDGQLTIASGAGSIFVEDDILMEQDPRVNKNSKDLLGLVAENSVVVVDNPANQTDCVIEASMFCRNGSLEVENYATSGLRGRLSVYGSIVQDHRGPVGTNLGGILNSGYTKSYAYDPRLFDPNFRPPMYPGYIPKTHSVIGWWESLRLPDYGKYGDI